MRFYYFSIFSWMAYAAVATLVIVLLWLIWTRAFKLSLKSPLYWGLVAAILVLPWSEELWIARNFDQLCRKDAGVFVHKTVEVDGFYDDTKHWWRQLAESQYRFVESRDPTTNKLWRVERAGEEVRHFSIEKRTARYEFKRINVHTPVAHQIKRFEDVVTDTQTGEVIGRYVNYYRGPFWFWASLGVPTIPCVETESAVRKYGTLSMYALTLLPEKL